MANEVTKVYCGKCRWFSLYKGPPSVAGKIYSRKKPPWDECRKPGNFEIEEGDNYKKHYRDLVTDLPAKVKNKNNDCTGYEFKQKWWKILVRKKK